MPDFPPPPREQRFKWRRWAPYPNKAFRSPDDPPPDAVIYMLEMGNYEVARIWLQPDGRWLAIVATCWAEQLQRRQTIDDEQQARDRVLAWAHREFDRLFATRPMAYAADR